MDLAAYLGTVAGLVAFGAGAIYAIVGQLGRRIDQQGAGLNARIDDLSTRVSRIETQNDAILAAVGDLGQRVAHLEARGA